MSLPDVRIGESPPDPSTAIVRAYKADAVSMLGALYGRCWDCLMSDRIGEEKMLELARDIGRLGMRAKRAMVKAAKARRP